MRIGCDVHHGCWMRTDARGAGLSGRSGIGSRRSRRVLLSGGDRDTSGRLGRRRHGSQNTGIAARVKPRSRKAVRHFPQGFTRGDSPGEDEWWR
jgi:hypothetical protein